jgi:hypothetical protein
MFDRAMREHVEMIEVRVRGLYVRSRALFAEAVVAALVDGTSSSSPPLRGTSKCRSRIGVSQCAYR